MKKTKLNELGPKLKFKIQKEFDKGFNFTKAKNKGISTLTFGKRIQAFRFAKNASQKEFASYLGISQASLSGWEKGRRIPSAERAASIARKLKESESYWVQLALQDHLDQAGLKLRVSVA